MRSTWIPVFLLALLLWSSGCDESHNPCPMDDRNWWIGFADRALDGHCLCFCAYDGQLMVGGFFSHAGTLPAANVVAWDGRSWWPVGSADRVFRIDGLECIGCQLGCCKKKSHDCMRLIKPIEVVTELKSKLGISDVVADRQ